MISWLRSHWQTLVNWFLVFTIGRFAFRQRMEAWRNNRFDALEGVFVTQNLAGLVSVLIRSEHRSIEKRVWPQIVALTAFFSGAGFVQTDDASSILIRLARGFIFAAVTIGILSFMSLGRSFGILVAVRQVRTTGLYRFIRHPMYLSDLLWRIGYILKNACKRNLVLFLISSGCYVYRAILEERFLDEDPAYLEYRRQVPFRFIPGIF
ncbi:MAG: isoprenylcysteine carboxylmethyltransferase family protein [Candidatus Riflebacteria bacterium]|nr:isoprenylcysteine carboxylmethyltransferase family protein [Candidatus Riflebacteria bacterium]